MDVTWLNSNLTAQRVDDLNSKMNINNNSRFERKKNGCSLPGQFGPTRRERD
jgi:hypothetical protein